MGFKNSAPQGVYTFAEVLVTVNGTVLNGFARGNEAVSLTRTLDKGTIEYGADGSGQQQIYQPDPYEITFRTLAIAPINNFLAGIFTSYSAGRVSPIDVSIKAIHGGFGFFCKALLANHGTISAGFDKNDYEWLFRTAKAKIIPGTWDIAGSGNITGNQQQ